MSIMLVSALCLQATEVIHKLSHMCLSCNSAGCTDKFIEANGNALTVRLGLTCQQGLGGTSSVASWRPLGYNSLGFSCSSHSLAFSF